MQLFFSVNELCQLLSVGRTTIYQAFREGRLRPVKFGRRTLVHKDELDRFLANLPKV